MAVQTHGPAWNKVVACYLAWKALALLALVSGSCRLDRGVNEVLGELLNIRQPCDRIEMIWFY